MAQKIIHTTCPMDCPDTCSLAVNVENDQVISIGPADENPATEGFICTKVSRFSQRFRANERIRTPMIRSRKSDLFSGISWEDAISEIVSRFRNIIADDGAEAILPYHYGGSNGFLTDDFTDDYFFSRLGASRLGKTLCALPTGMANQGLYGKMPGSAYEYFEHSQLIIIWGANPHASHIHLTPWLTRAKKRGAQIVLIDPVQTLPAGLISLHLPVLPGTDLALALALINLWQANGQLDREFMATHCINSEPLLAQAARWDPARSAAVCGIQVRDIEKLAGIYAESSPAIIRCGWGLERNRNGAHAAAAILAIPALMGKFGIKGGGYALSNGAYIKLKRDRIIPFPENNTRVLNMTQLGRILNDKTLDPQVNALFVYNANPVATVPDQNEVIRGLKRSDLFTVVFDQVMTDTAVYADIVLPATTFLEHYDLKRAYGTFHLGTIEPVVAPFGQARSNHTVFAMLGKAMGWNDPIFSWHEQEIITMMQKNLQYYPGTEHLPEPPVQFKDVVPDTKNNKVDLTPAILTDTAYQFQEIEENTFPLTLISPSTSKTINSTMGEFNLPRQELIMHPMDANKRKIDAGSKVRVFNGLGEVICRVKIDEKVRTGVIILPKGAWRKASLNASTATALCPDDVNQIGGAACYNDARVEVEPVL